MGAAPLLVPEDIHFFLDVLANTFPQSQSLISSSKSLQLLLLYSSLTEKCGPYASPTTKSKVAQHQLWHRCILQYKDSRSKASNTLAMLHTLLIPWPTYHNANIYKLPTTHPQPVVHALGELVEGCVVIPVYAVVVWLLNCLQRHPQALKPLHPSFRDTFPLASHKGCPQHLQFLGFPSLVILQHQLACYFPEVPIRMTLLVYSS